MKTRILLNGKKAGLKDVRAAIAAVRESSPDLEVRVTYEAGDIERFVAEASTEGVQRVIAGGGDGTINEVVDALMRMVSHFTAENLSQVIAEIKKPTPDGQFVCLFQAPWIEISSKEKIVPFNLDGEPYRSSKIRFESVPSAVNLVLPKDCPMLK